MTNSSNMIWVGNVSTFNTLWDVSYNNEISVSKKIINPKIPVFPHIINYVISSREESILVVVKVNSLRPNALSHKQTA